MEAAEIMVNPTQRQERAFKRACKNKAARTIKVKKNPTGKRISIRERNRLRAELAEDLFESMTATSENAGVEGVAKLIEEVRDE